jgi:hypothetical protein
LDNPWIKELARIKAARHMAPTYLTYKEKYNFKLLMIAAS